MLAEGLTSIQPLDQTIFTHNLESELYSSTNKSPHSTLKVTLKAQKVFTLFIQNRKTMAEIHPQKRKTFL